MCRARDGLSARAGSLTGHTRFAQSRLGDQNRALPVLRERRKKKHHTLYGGKNGKAFRGGGGGNFEEEGKRRKRKEHPQARSYLPFREPSMKKREMGQSTRVPREKRKCKQPACQGTLKLVQAIKRAVLRQKGKINAIQRHSTERRRGGKKISVSSPMCVCVEKIGARRKLC